MTAKIIDGKAIANNLVANIRKNVEEYCNKGFRKPTLAVILVGEDPASAVYVRNKKRQAENSLIDTETYSYHLPDTTTQEELESLILKLNQDDNLDAILVQLPLPKHLDSSRIIELIAPDKDVDGFHPYNVGRLAQRIPTIRACTPKGIMTMLHSIEGLQLKGINAVIVGASNIVGRPMALELLLAGSTVTVTHKFTKNLEDHVRGAELLVAAVGKPGIIKSEWIKEGAIIIDVGINKTDKGLVGDIDFETAKEKASYITPVPGGVGPMTVATLMENTFENYKKHLNLA